MLRSVICLLLSCLIVRTAAEDAPGAAVSTNHWAYQALTRPRMPHAPGVAMRNPVDAFIHSRLAEAGAPLSPEADRRTLLRRITFDLTGLPPTPAELLSFVADPAPEAYERVVDRLLADPRYGERWARHWMDAAHFAETHGHDQDRIRENAWPYRDYLVRSFNTDTPYARFVQEQVAGDALFPGQPQSTVALGFIAAGPWDESSLRDIREDTLDRQIGRYLDRDDMVSTVMSVFTSSTVHCARCHDHKFDPISQRDYYALQAVFAGVERAERTFDSDPAVHVRRQELRHRMRQIERQERDYLLGPEATALVARWEADQTHRTSVWRTLSPETMVSSGGATLVGQPDGSLLASGIRPDRDIYTLTVPAPEFTVTAVRLELIPDDSLPKRGPGRQEQNGNLHLSEFEVQLVESGSKPPRPLPLVNPSADFNQEGWTIAHAFDGNAKTAWGIHPREGEAHQATVELAEPLRAPEGARLVFVLRQEHGGGHLIGRLRLSLTDAATPVRILPEAIEQRLAVASADRTPEQRMTLATHVLSEATRVALATLPPPSRVYAAAADFTPDGGLKPSLKPRTVQRLRRGEITQPLEIAAPGALACVAALPSRFTVDDAEEEGARRAELARWLASPDNPLTWRSIVNRVWHHHFGRGLVDTPNDFGRMGSAPSHPELLDWLAVWFRDDAQGSLKQLHRLLVTSATYRRASQWSVVGGPSPLRTDTAAPLNTSPDPDNRLLGRMNRLRMDAECVHDAILQASGGLDLRMGGPSDRQFDLQPGIHVTPRVDYLKFDANSAAGRRRSVYRFLFRTLPDPFMEALDCPAGDQLTAVRNNSVTVQQALALWNNAFVARQAEHLAERLQAESVAPEQQIQRAFELTLGRPATAREVLEFGEYSARHGLANACRLLLNSNEFVFVN
ncbi:MAG: hypothetical protein RIS76_2840 [Verrucomicrobiota bacterium]